MNVLNADVTRNINDLPREMIEEIFFTHIFINLGSRQQLLATCRKWYFIATTYSKLWETIALGRDTSLPPTAVCCQNLASFAVAVTRASGTAFSLCLGALNYVEFRKDLKQFKESVGDGWFSRCRTLTILPQRGPIPDAEPATLFHSCDMKSLETINMRHTLRHVRYEALLLAILHQASASATKLHSLHIEYDCCGFWHLRESKWIINAITSSSNVRPRITTLHIAGIQSLMPWSIFPNLIDLELHTPEKFELQPGLASTQIAQLVLNGGKGWCIGTPQEWPRITRLTLCNLGFGELAHIITLPSLISLRLVRCLVDMKHIKAPMLEEIVINVHNGSSEIYPLVENTSLTPRVIRTDFQEEEYIRDRRGNHYTEKDLKLFRMTFPFWSRVKELHLNILSPYFELDEGLGDVVSRISNREVCPYLRSLTILYCLEYERLVTSADGEDVVHELRRLMGTRIAEGSSKPLNVFKLGWKYPISDLPGQWSSEVWNDCLRPELNRWDKQMHSPSFITVTLDDLQLE